MAVVNTGTSLGVYGLTRESAVYTYYATILGVFKALNGYFPLLIKLK